MQATARAVTAERQHGGRGHLTCGDTDGCRRCVPGGLWWPLLSGKGLRRLPSVVGALSAHDVWLAARGAHTELGRGRCARGEGGGGSAPALATRRGQVPEPGGAFSTLDFIPASRLGRRHPLSPSACEAEDGPAPPGAHQRAPRNSRGPGALLSAITRSPFLDSASALDPSAAPGVPRRLLPTRRSGMTSLGARPLSPHWQDTLSQV